MKNSIRLKLENLKDRFDEIEALLSDAEIIADQNRFRDLSKEYAELEEVVKSFNHYQSVSENLEQAREMEKDNDPDIREMAADEISSASEELEKLDLSLQKLLLPKDSKDSCNVFLEIRAGTGGDEAAIFSGDLFRMYSRFAESHNWRSEVITERPGEHGGYKEIIARIEGKDVYEKLKFESGAHRVQRVPETETQGRIHTSAAGVLVFPEVDEPEEVEISQNEIRVDVFRSSGPGGQSVNTTDSAVRITHLETGIVVSMQNEKSQLQNREAAMRVLRARLLAFKQEAIDAEQSAARKSQVRTVDRSERIRTYNFPENRIADHRTGYKAYNLDQVMDGALDPIVESAIKMDEEARLAALGNTESAN